MRDPIGTLQTCKKKLPFNSGVSRWFWRRIYTLETPDLFQLTLFDYLIFLQYVLIFINYPPKLYGTNTGTIFR